jgi:hypothetical protein
MICWVAWIYKLVINLSHGIALERQTQHPTQGVALGYNIAPLWGFEVPNLMAVLSRLGITSLKTMTGFPSRELGNQQKPSLQRVVLP